VRAPTGVTTNGRLLHERFLYTLSVLVLRKVLSIIMIEEYFFILCLIILMAGKTFNKFSKLPSSKLKLEDDQATCLMNLQKEANLSDEEISKRFTIENGRVVGADLSGISLDQVDLKLLPTLKTLKLSSIRGPLAYLPDCLEELELDSCSIERLENEGEEFLCPLLRTLRLTNTTLREPSLLPAGLKSLTAINSTITEEMGKILLTLELLDTSKVGSLTRCD